MTMAQLRTLIADQRGTAVIEMALAAPILAVLLVGMIDISNAYSKKLQLEQAAQRTIERAQQVSQPTDTLFLAALQAEAVEAGGAGTTAVVDFWLECSGTRAATFQTGCADGTTPARFVTVDITGKYTPMFANVRFQGSNTDGSYTMHGKAGLRMQ